MADTIRHPVQPLYKDENGTIRFKENKIVRAIKDAASRGEKLDLNDIAVMGFDDDEQRQFAQLIGYSLDGFSSLSYADDATCQIAEDLTNHDEINQLRSRVNFLENKLSEIQEGLKPGLSILYEKHPDDFTDRF